MPLGCPAVSSPRRGRSRVGGKRKLSKRKDPEASVDFYIGAGYPAEAVLYYLRGLANGRLAEMPLVDALAEPIRLAECGVAGPLVDLVKLEDISADHIATLTGEQILEALRPWAATHDPELVELIDVHYDLALRALAVEREGADNPRKDLRKWWDFRPAYGFFFTELFTPVTDPADERLGGLDPHLVRAFVGDFADSYQPLDDPKEWFDQIRPARRQARVRSQPQRAQEEPRHLPRFHPRSVTARAGHPHRLHPQPRPPRHRHHSRPRRSPTASSRDRQVMPRTVVGSSEAYAPHGGSYRR